MKLRYLLPFLFLSLFPRESEAQLKAIGNQNSLDVRSAYVDVSARDTFGLQDLVNIKGDAELKFRNNAIYGIRNGALNHSYGGNLDFRISAVGLGGYYNKSKQSNRTENGTSTETPFGPITTRTTILNESNRRDFGFRLGYRDFSVGYEQANGNNKIDVNTIITVAGNETSAPFSSALRTESGVYGIWFKNDFFKFIQNKHQSTTEDGEQNEEGFDNYLAKVSYPFKINGREIATLSAYYSDDFSGFLNVGPFRTTDVKVLQDIDVNISYDGRTDGFRATLSTSDFSRLHQTDYEAGLEDRLRAVPAVRRVLLERDRRYLADMYFTDDFSFTFSVDKDSVDFHIDKDDITASLNLKYALGHYSKDRKEVGVKIGPAIGTWDFDKKEARAGVFLWGK